MQRYAFHGLPGRSSVAQERLSELGAMSSQISKRKYKWKKRIKTQNIISKNTFSKSVTYT